MRRFSLYRRRGKVFYCQFWNEETHRYMSGISTGKTTKNEAVATIVQWEQTGLPKRDQKVAHLLTLDTILSAIRTGGLSTTDTERIIAELKRAGLIATATIQSENTVSLVSFLNNFWTYENSPYVREKLAHGHSLSKRHCYDRKNAVKNYWKEHFGEKLLSDVTHTDLREFSVSIAKDRASQTVNHVLNAGTVALRWAHTNGLIPTNPADELLKFTIRRKERGILSQDEAQKLFKLKWVDERCRVANLLAMTTGMRAGEVAGLRVMDIGETTVTVAHSWSEQDNLKDTKTGERRTIPLLASVRSALLKVANQNPHGTHPASFVFWSIRDADRPTAHRYFSDELRDLIPKISLSESDADDPVKLEKSRLDWKERNVTFHSWRHFFATHLADRIDKRKAMTATGHRTGRVFDVYANHENAETLQEVGNGIKQVFRWLSKPENATN